MRHPRGDITSLTLIYRTSRTSRTSRMVGTTGDAPRRGAFFIARVSRHAVPMTPGINDAYMVYDPDRVSLPRAILHDDRPRQGVALTGQAISATPWQGRGIL